MSTTKEGTVIGAAALEYNENGQLEAAVFHPKIKVNYDDIKAQLGDCKGKSIDEVKKCAQLLIAAFFSKLSDIELRDVESTEIITDVVKGTRYESGGLKEVELEFIFKHSK
jgi:hypothetical protein